MEDTKFCDLANTLMDMDEDQRLVAIFSLPMDIYRGLNMYLDTERKFLFADIKGAVRGRKLTFNL
jgi:hypothetical protein